MSRNKQLWRHGKQKGYSDEWYTPPELVKALGRFDLDPCAARDGNFNHARINWRPPTNGLTHDWQGRVWLNPPFSQVGQWLPRLLHRKLKPDALRPCVG